MPINACSINAFTINSLTCRRRNFDVQPPQPVASGGGNVQQFRYHRWASEQEDEQQFVNLESSSIAITLTLGDRIIEKSFENIPDPIIPMITVSRINIAQLQPIINISKLSLIKKRKRP